MGAREQYIEGLRRGFIDRSYGLHVVEYKGPAPLLKGVERGITLWEETEDSLMILEPEQECNQ